MALTEEYKDHTIEYSEYNNQFIIYDSSGDALKNTYESPYGARKAIDRLVSVKYIPVMAILKSGWQSVPKFDFGKITSYRDNQGMFVYDNKKGFRNRSYEKLEDLFLRSEANMKKIVEITSIGLQIKKLEKQIDKIVKSMDNITKEDLVAKGNKDDN